MSFNPYNTGQYNSTPLSVSSGATAPVAIDTNANQLVRPAAPKTAQYSTAAINFSSSGSNTVIAGSGSQTIRVFKIQFTVNGATNVYFLDSTPTTFSGTYVLTGNGSSFSDWANGEPLFVTAAGKGFQINSSAAVSVQGEIWYTQS